VPAEVLAQRPDIYAAAINVVAASADSTQARARQWPRISLGGSIGPTRIAFGSETSTGIAWSFGPVTVTVPLFDGGTRRANAAAARVRYETATAIYAARLRDGIRDVERALVTLESSAQRTEAALIAATGFERSFRATDASYRAGLANLFDLEDARRNMVATQRAVIDLQRERVAGWIALYRALGGGWSPASIDGAIPNPVQR
jgi:outer membrane protein TolC